ncbi:hypothetical protein F4678DRAFT_484227 [Xylaria arbuscula]|nr:hypothetical protein F4678DRAFT_484227 [Xylaria arbuscula]
MTSNFFSFLTACCFPRERSRPKSSVRRAGHYNARVRANLGLEVPVRDIDWSAHTARPANEQSASRPRIMKEGRLSATANSNVPWSMSSMEPAELKELFNIIHATLEHVPYAICGLGALIDHGFTARRASRISILCPQESKKNVKAWALARGYERYTDSIGIPLRDGSVRRVRIKYVEFGFERLQRVRSSFSHATVLSLTSQLDNIAAGFLDSRRRGDERALKTVAGDVFFVLKRMAVRRESVDSRLLPTFLGEAFFADFTARYPAARREMTRAGIDISAALAKHRTESNLREHDELLKQYGMEGNVITRQPGPFERMRSLDHSKSVYTLADPKRESVIIPPLPHRPQPSHVPAKTAGKNHSGRNLTARKPPVQPKAAKRPVTDWI